MRKQEISEQLVETVLRSIENKVIDGYRFVSSIDDDGETLWRLEKVEQ